MMRQQKARHPEKWAPVFRDGKVDVGFRLDDALKAWLA
jgi:hypothetical protein